MKRGDRRKLLISVVIVLLAGFFATSIGSYITSSRALRTGIVSEQLPLTGDSVYSEIQRDLLRPVSISDQMAHDTFVIDWATSGEQSTDAIVRYLKSIQERFGTTTSFFVSDATRAYYHPTGIVQRISPDDPADAWYFRLRSAEALYEINVDFDRANSETTTVFINFKVLDEDGKFLGVTGVGLTLATIDATVAKYEQRFGRRISFVNETGNIVLSGPALAGETRTLAQRDGIRSIAKAITAGGKAPQQLSYQDSSGTVLLNTRYLPELKWHLIVEQNEMVTIRPLRNMLFVNLGIGLGAALLVFGAITLTMSRYQRRLELDATIDSLTGLLNRRSGEERLAQRMRDATAHDSFSALLVDIDHFKQVNDTHGHLVGDEVIHEVVEQLRAATRNTDALIRWGGEEFLVLLPHCPNKPAGKIAQAAVSLIATQHTRTRVSIPATTVSIGVATYTPGESRNDFLSRIDALMYDAKLRGRNQVINSNADGLTHPSGSSPAQQ
jgi:diguanylate cyclase (GGDEF)-like protein